ncbi:amino acid adenylation domain-containing protein [Streptosporangium sp. NPDC000239]|uniref:amino acid adenylation domain-containing protein n=1 Tax=Streptosporangium sp. NPDC000239 TaxID=3154248 RepID=UPI0033237C08
MNPRHGRLPSLLGALSALAEDTPRRTALVADDRGVDYGELHERVQRTAAALVRRGVGPAQRIAVVGHKTVDAVVALLAVQRAGAAYVPLDPRAPAARLADLVADARCPLVLVSATDTDLARDLAERTGVLPLGVGEAAAEPATAPLPEEISPESVAYCMYTSGSTGRPKGVQIPHRAVDAFFAAVHPLLRVGPDDRCLNTSALHFDVSVVDLLYPLTRGATVHLAPAVPMPPLLNRLIEQERITYFAAVGSTLTLLADHARGFAGRDLSHLRRVMTGAEVLQPHTVQRWLAAAPQLVVINGYGPTEATCLVVAHPIDEREPDRTAPYPIGRPLDGVTVRFLRDDGHIDEEGPGELLVAGAQLMSGYLERPEEERRAFLDLDGTRFYRTGDQAHRDADAVLHFHGRRDDEVKVRGYRVNTQEVRQTLEAHRTVGRAFVTASRDGRGREILACAVTPPGAPASVPCGDESPLPALDADRARALRTHLSERLPGYMVPADFRLLDAVPLLSSGKPDVRGIVRRLTAASPRGDA